MNQAYMLQKVRRCQETIGYEFKDEHLGWEALQMAGNGIKRSGSRVFDNGNKRLAILGEFVIDIILSQEWYQSGGDEGAWNDIRQTFIANASLGKVGLVKHLEECVQLGNGQSKVTQRMMATTVEAIVGATYLDGGHNGLTAAKNVLQELGITPAEPAN